MSKRLLESLYEEKDQVGFTDGVHHSVLQFASWHNDARKVRKTARVQRVAIVWDPDHDERVLDVADAMYVRGLLAPVLLLSEMKGMLYVALRPNASRLLDLEDYRSEVSAAATPDGDSWMVEVIPYESRSEALRLMSGERGQCYIDGIDAVWQLCEAHKHKSLLPPTEED